MIYPLMFLRPQSEYFQSWHVSKYYCHAKHFSGWVSGFGWKHHFGVLHGGLKIRLWSLAEITTTHYTTKNTTDLLHVDNFTS